MCLEKAPVLFLSLLKEKEEWGEQAVGICCYQ